MTSPSDIRIGGTLINEWRKPGKLSVTQFRTVAFIEALDLIEKLAAENDKLKQDVSDLYIKTLEPAETHDELRFDLAEAEKERDRYREALEWYANRDNYCDDGAPGHPSNDPAEWNWDLGAVAREALNGGSDT